MKSLVTCVIASDSLSLCLQKVIPQLIHIIRNKIILTVFYCNYKERGIISSYVYYKQHWRIFVIRKLRNTSMSGILLPLWCAKALNWTCIISIRYCEVFLKQRHLETLTSLQFSYNTYHSTSSTFQTEPIVYELSLPSTSRWKPSWKFLMLTEVTSVPIYFSSESS
jgi:hypothetical protein